MSTTLAIILTCTAAYCGAVELMARWLRHNRRRHPRRYREDRP